MANNMQALIDMAVRQSEGERTKPRRWSAEDEDYLRKNLGYQTEAEMAKALGRTAVAVRLRWKRDLKLTSPSKVGDVLTANHVARILHLDSHKITHWADQGLIPYRLMAGGRKIRLIRRADFEAWCLDPQNWIYFDARKVQDKELKRRILKAKKAWGDEWWMTPRIAKLHGVKTNDVMRYIKKGWLPARQIKVSLGGRHPQLRWMLWFVLKSDALKVKFRVRRYKGKKA